MTNPIGRHQSIKKSNRCWSNPAHPDDDADLDRGSQGVWRGLRSEAARVQSIPTWPSTESGRSRTELFDPPSTTFTPAPIPAATSPLFLDLFTEITHVCNPLIGERPAVSSTSGWPADRLQRSGTFCRIRQIAASPQRRAPLAKSPAIRCAMIIDKNCGGKLSNARC
jgi:hypothetical protein